MNSTISITNPSTWKSIKAQYIAAACGLALALSAVVASTPWSNGPASPEAFDNTAGFPAFKEDQTMGFVYYLVGSRQEAALFDAALSESAVFGSAGVQTITLVVDTPEAERLVVEASRELMQSGVNYRIVDLRTPVPNQLSLNPVERSILQASTQLDADIMASVISTERATSEITDASTASTLQ